MAGSCKPSGPHEHGDPTFCGFQFPREGGAPETMVCRVYVVFGALVLTWADSTSTARMLPGSGKASGWIRVTVGGNAVAMATSRSF